jgi:very-short-patch-repair endonuclease
MTDAERKLWSAPRRDALGVRFRRQHPIGPYVADFACYPLKIAIEVDGATHGSDDERRHDCRRDAYLRCEGWVVLRFTNEDMFKRLDGVLDAIGLAIRETQTEQARR